MKTKFIIFAGIVNSLSIILIVITLSGCGDAISANETFNLSRPFGVPCMTWQSADGMVGGMSCDWSNRQ